MRFLVDAQLPPALARLLDEHGHEADHVTDIGPGDASDQDLWRFALANHAVIVTKDEDFSNMIARGGDTPAVGCDRPPSQGNGGLSSSNAAYVAQLQPLVLPQPSQT